MSSVDRQAELDRFQAEVTARRADLGRLERTAERWVDLERLLGDVGSLPWSMREVDARDDWAKSLVQAAAFSHVAAEPRCTGYTLASSGRTSCGLCGWRMSAWMAAAGTEAGARFALAAIAGIGEVVELAIGAVVTALFEAVLP
jgi:hypothetical protein